MKPRRPGVATNSRTDDSGGDGSRQKGRFGRAKRGAASEASQPAAAARTGDPAAGISKRPVPKAGDPDRLTSAAAELQALDEEHYQKLAASQRSRVIKAIVLGVIGVLFVA